MNRPRLPASHAFTGYPFLPEPCFHQSSWHTLGQLAMVTAAWALDRGALLAMAGQLKTDDSMNQAKPSLCLPQECF